MEKQSFTFSLSKFLESLRSAKTAGMDVSTVWRFFITSFLLGVAGVALFAYLTYSWAVSDDAPVLPSIGSRDTQTITELKEVIASYQKKEKDYLYLMAVEPPAPGFRRGVGATVPSTMNFEAELASSTLSAAPDASPAPDVTTTTPRIID
jgi:hypothetical protein